ncbi:PhyR family response regulator anti-anti-sigma factor [Hansschlegelia sp.]|uniref:PhyR family response regulator anti-anti-sigma factor n=1 Tax=Hansschlegelia sp. TaxID=2041892 RepID=UPI002C2A7400|nr:response regulator [Hansschlegelia sp.]HVI28781.1 response regulator [Hansschlegelia sp.]
MDIGELTRQLPYLRRHARMLLGRQDHADLMIEEALRELLRTGDCAAIDYDPRRQLLKALYGALYAQGLPETATSSTETHLPVDARLQSLSLPRRSVLLLLAVERLSVADASEVTGLSGSDVLRLASEAQNDVERRLETDILIIEDEWAIARDLRRIVSDLGHRVTGVAASREQALELAARDNPGLVLADLHLADGDSGVDAVREIFRDRPTPAIFVTAFPERLLARARPEPIYLITKPFSPAMIKSTVSQALFFA